MNYPPNNRPNNRPNNAPNNAPNNNMYYNAPNNAPNNNMYYNAPNNAPNNNMYHNAPNNAPNNIFKKMSKMVLVVMIAQVLSAILSLFGTITASASILGQSISDSGNMFGMEDGFATFLAVIVLFGLLAAAVLTFLGITNKKLTLFAFIANAVVALALLIAMIYVPTLVPSGFGSSMSVGFNFLGYLHFIIVVGAGVLEFFNFKGKQLF